MKNINPDPFMKDTATIQPNVSSLFAYNDTNSSANENENCHVSSFQSVSVFLSGIILARFGLWISDLTVTQTLQERVEEEHRGVINGVQESANSIMNTLKFALIVGLPHTETFGYLISASYTMAILGAICFVIYVLRNKRK